MIEICYNINKLEVRMIDLKIKLKQLADENYRKFHSSLCPNTNNILGVRLPYLRELAKEIVKDNPIHFLENYICDFYEENMIYGLVIGYMKCDFETRLHYLDKFIPMIDNWAVCDSTCTTFKFTKKNLDNMWNYLKKYLSSDSEFELRFVCVMLMDYYITEEYVKKVLYIYNNIKSDKYYVQMAIAWGISVIFVKYPDITMNFLENNSLNDFTYNKALQKIIESNRVDTITKNKIRAMKRK